MLLHVRSGMYIFIFCSPFAFLQSYKNSFFFFVKSHFYLITAIPGLLWLQVLETSFKIAEGKKWNVVIDMTESLEYSASNTAGCRGSSGGIRALCPFFGLLALSGGIVAYTGLIMLISEEERELS